MSLPPCPCGVPAHSMSPPLRAMVEELIAETGEMVKVETPYGNYMVPRIFIAVHGIRADRMPQLARLYGFEEIPDEPG